MSVNLKNLASMCQDLKLLYVEDNAQARESTLNLLENFLQNITIAVDGQDALEKFKHQRFDFIITDINMPNIDGLEMLDTIRQIDTDISILILSAHNDSDYFLKAIPLDIDGYILKPLEYQQFIKVLYKVVTKIHIFKIAKDYKENLEKEVKLRNEEILHKLYFDSLTGLYSRYSFFRDIKSLKLPLILLIDIDKFKIVNEVYGSDVGSELLKNFATYLSLSVTDNNCKLYRLSSDEFAVIDSTTSLNPQKYEDLIDKIFNDLNNLKIRVAKNIITVDITIGVSTVEKNGYESAKIALDYAKLHKKHFIMYSNLIDQRKESEEILKCRDNITLAIDTNRVIAVFQPIVNQKGTIVKYETLMRLQESESSELITPFYFLDVAMKTRLYEHLSSIIIFKALHILKTTHNILSINFAYSDMKNKELLQNIEDFLIQNKTVGARTVFEILESEGIENYDFLTSFIKRFRAYGVRIAIDDFGTGFSNFEYILEIEPDFLKIDGSLVKDIDTDKKAFTLVKAIVEFSHKLNIKVIGEYVHSKVIFNMLKDLGVDEYQGFYFSEPLLEIGKQS